MSGIRIKGRTDMLMLYPPGLIFVELSTCLSSSEGVLSRWGSS